MTSTEDPEKLLEQVKKARGYVADYHVALAQNAPHLLKAYIDHVNQTKDSLKAIPLKYQELMLLATGMCNLYAPTIEVHAQKAKDAGATREEIADALAIGFLERGVAAFVMAAEPAFRPFTKK